ncbi:MAG: flagellar biosynthesis protein FlgN [Rhodosalinus sp.]
MTAADDVLDRLDRLIEEERVMLRAGQLSALADLLERKEWLVQRLAEAGAPDRAHPDLKRKIARNQALLDGALAGLREVARRLGRVRDLRQTLETYDSDGRRAAVVTPGQGRMERRA